jgi:prolyl oligopeptidase
MSYPEAEREERIDELHGTPVPDPYRWLENPGSGRTREWLAAQDELWRSHAARLPEREWLRARAARLADTGSITAPTWRGKRRFFQCQRPEQEHPVLFMADEGERVLVDPNVLDPSGVTTLDAWQPSLSGDRLAYQLSRGGTEQAELYVLDVLSGRVLDGPIGGCRYSPVVWLADGSAFYYVRNSRVCLHQVGTPADEDVLILGTSSDGPISYGLGGGADGRWLVVSVSAAGTQRNDLLLADLTAGSPAEPPLRPIQQGVDGRSAALVGRDGSLYAVTDVDAPRIRLCVGDPGSAVGPAGWRELVGQDPEAVLTDFVILDGPELDRPVVLVAWIRRAIAELSVHDLATGERLGMVALPGSGSIGPLAARPEGGHEAWFSYTDTVTPAAVWRFDAVSGSVSLWAAAPGTVTVPDVVTQQLTATSSDGRPVHVTVIGRADLEGPRSLILSGYGGFGVPLTPSYAADSLAWVEAGGVLAIAHLRGGGEEGLTSHRAGMREHKQRVFDDFIAAAEKLVAEGWTAPERLGIWGESNGGLLVGAALTQRPDLFAAAVCMAPLLDMVRYEHSGLGPSWRGEYGSAADPEQFRWLLSYSPYHHVLPGTVYPATLFTVFGGDTRVDPMHARKMCAALQWASPTSPTFLRHETNVGHGPRATGRALELATDMLAFMAAHTGLNTLTRV